MRSARTRPARPARILCLLPFLAAASAAQAAELVNATGQLRGSNLALGAVPPAGTYTIGAHCDVAGPMDVLATNTGVVTQLVARPIGVVSYVPAALAFEAGRWPLLSSWAGLGDSRTKAELAPLPADVGSDSLLTSCPAVEAGDPGALSDDSSGVGRILVFGSGTYELRASASLNLPGSGWGGHGVGHCEDPYLLARGSYLHAPSLTSLSLTNTSRRMDTEAVLSFAATSSVAPDPESPVWWLNLTLAGDGELKIEFHSSSLLDLALDDAAVEAELLTALDHSDPQRVTFAAGHAAGYTLFSTTLNATTAFEFGEQAGAIAQRIACREPGDSDCDGTADALDLCPFYRESDPLADADGDRRGDECECGDQNGDGDNTVSDLVAISIAIFEPGLRTPLCDANGDVACDVRDIIAVNAELFSPGSTSTCARQPVAGP